MQIKFDYKSKSMVLQNSNFKITMDYYELFLSPEYATSNCFDYQKEI